jgi:hypothetical protein
MNDNAAALPRTPQARRMARRDRAEFLLKRREDAESHIFSPPGKF